MPHSSSELFALLEALFAREQLRRFLLTFDPTFEFPETASTRTECAFRCAEQLVRVGLVTTRQFWQALMEALPRRATEIRSVAMRFLDAELGEVHPPRDLAPALPAPRRREVSLRREPVAFPLQPLPCFGRGGQLTTLEAALLAAEATYSVVVGPPGVGKSALACEVGGRPAILRRFATRRYFARLNSTKSVGDAAAAIAHALGLVRPRQSSARGLVLSHLERIGDPVLLVLDSAEAPLDAEKERGETAFAEFVAELCRLPAVWLVLTMKGSGWPDTQRRPVRLALERLADADAVRLIEHISGFDLGSEAVEQEVHGLLQGVPLLIDLFARLVKDEGAKNGPS